MSGNDEKRAAAEKAALLVEPGMKVGLGTGSTAALLVDALGRRWTEGLRFLAVATSEATHRQAEALGIRLATLDEEPTLDLTIDGADEIGPGLALVKGGGGALLREKLVAAASGRMVVIADASKRVATLGRFPLPIEIMPFGAETTRRRVASLLEAEAGRPVDLSLRAGKDGAPFVTDGQHWILDAALGRIADPARLAGSLKSVLGVVEHGLFVDMAEAALIGTPDGVMEETREGQARPGDSSTCA
ncbi:ribose-5-phosphate isomerase RpiA [Enterovirga rhinocerotis]|uniref:Ribose-5-phosphate isomerase A n=1 Tax=Enterovirga rhinocerotis TaxID=1339210 RepID=A0A4V3DYS5_9HYPH|nr:ribose-5-phosphate isomerase RpiA [Enterovirga rhinocerotis]TDR93769.1 ribose-5-phosphate isomerase [Enterovirga rhinocerotis]